MKLNNKQFQVSLNNLFKKCFSQSGNLYTWGRNTASIGVSLPSSVTSIYKPQLVQQFDNNAKKVSMGYYHTAVITENGELFTFGNGKYGCLGHNDGDTNHVQPKKVEFFSKNNLKVVDVQCGETHTICLTDDGDVWSWGYGGKPVNFIIDLMFSVCGPLGHGDNVHRYTPTPIQKLRELPPIKQIACGYSFGFALNENNDLYQWGKGDFGVLGNGSFASVYVPEENDYFKQIKQSQNLTIKQIKSANNYSIAQFSDGNLYGWGSNEAGQMGIKTDIGLDYIETSKFPTQVINSDFEGKKITGFDISEDLLTFQLDSNEVLWSGMKLEYQPAYLRLPKDIKKIKQVAAGHRSLGVLTEDNKIYMKNKFVDYQNEDIETGIQMTDNSIFNGGDILQIGSTYRNNYAIVKN